MFILLYVHFGKHFICLQGLELIQIGAVQENKNYNSMNLHLHVYRLKGLRKRMKQRRGKITCFVFRIPKTSDVGLAQGTEKDP